MNAITMKSSDTMSSREIAELVGKNHSHVLRDIKAMIPAVYAMDQGEAVRSYSWEAATSKDLSQFLDRIDIKGILINTREDNGQIEAINLDRFHTEILITGYDVKRRAAVIKRWHDLESGAAAPLHRVSAEDRRLALVTELSALETQSELEEQIAEAEEVQRAAEQQLSDLKRALVSCAPGTKFISSRKGLQVVPPNAVLPAGVSGW